MAFFFGSCRDTSISVCRMELGRSLGTRVAFLTGALWNGGVLLIETGVQGSDSVTI